VERRGQQVQERIEETGTVRRSRDSSATKLMRIAKRAEERPRVRFENLMYLINEETLCQCHSRLSGKKATGLDNTTKEEYGKRLEENITDLLDRMKRQAYKPQPARQVEIVKASGGMRPLAISCYEDKLVQMATRDILEACFENEFLPTNYGFRKGKSCHDALREVNRIVMTGKVGYVLDVDIARCFDSIDHKLLMQAVEFRVTDKNLIRLLWRMFKAGILSDGELRVSGEGTPQGSIVSPILANIYLHFVMDDWFRLQQKTFNGETHFVRYADDVLFFFQYQQEAVRFYQELRTRLARFGLKVQESKSKLIHFNRFSYTDNRKEGKRSETFDFLGFTHYFGLTRKGKPRMKRKTNRKRLNAKLLEFKQWLRKGRNLLKGSEIIAKTKSKLLGHYRYYGVTDNCRSTNRYFTEVVKMLFKWLNRRSQKRSFDWETFGGYLALWLLPRPRIYRCVTR